jgi:hypothetical protein
MSGRFKLDRNELAVTMFAVGAFLGLFAGFFIALANADSIFQALGK